MKDLKKLESIIGFQFADKELLMQSVVHRSYLNEHPEYKSAHNERLEFLGDAVLELVITDYLYRSFPNPEGELTNWRAALVNANMMATVAANLGLEEFLHMSKGEAKDVAGKARHYILANAIEAVIGALYLDQGYDAAKTFIHKSVLIHLDNIIKKKLYKDPKSRFQEIAQERDGVTPNYKVIEETGPDHAREFVVGVFIGKEMVALGKGMSKQEAQLEAAARGMEAKGWD